MQKSHLDYFEIPAVWNTTTFSDHASEEGPQK